MGERNPKHGALIIFPVSLTRPSSSLSHTSGRYLEVPRRPLTNIGLEPFPLKIFWREAFRAPATRQQATPVFQRSTPASPTHCSKRTQEVKHHREGVRRSRKRSRLPESKIARRCPGAHQHSSTPPLSSKLGSTAAAPLGSVPLTTPRRFFLFFGL